MLAKQNYVDVGVRRCSIDSRSEWSGEESMNRMYVLMYRGNWLNAKTDRKNALAPLWTHRHFHLELNEIKTVSSEPNGTTTLLKLAIILT